MILPVLAYGHPVLRKVADHITAEYKDLSVFLKNMWETMYASNGVGLAAPQVGKAIRVFVVDTEQIVEGFDDEDLEEFPDEKPVKMVFINPVKVEDSGKLWVYNEGCLSIPKVREDIKRTELVTMKWVDENFQEQEGTFSGVTARVIQHEYDHLEGKLFIDYLTPFQKRLIRKKLDDISTGRVRVDYRMLFNK